MPVLISMTGLIQTSQINIPPGFIDLGLGDPQFALLPLDLIHQAAGQLFAGNDPSFLQYGAEQGDGRFRQALAKFLSRGYGFLVESDSLFVTAGVSQALDLICTLFTRPGDIIFVEEPSYFLALRIFADHGLRVIPIRTDESGLVIESLEEKLSEFHPKFLYLIPVFQNPTGHTLTRERRARLVALSGTHDFLVVADEVYQFLNYTTTPPSSFAAWTAERNVIALGSFSKILAPGLRLGWIQAESEKINCLVGCGLLDSGGGLNPFVSSVVREVIESGGLEKNIGKLKAVYGSRLIRMESSLRRHIPEAQFVTPAGGYFFWVHLPGVETEALREKARARHVDIRPGILFSSRGGLREYMRLSFVFYDEEEIEEGIQRLAKCL